jgi:hypothetical protein
MQQTAKEHQKVKKKGKYQIMPQDKKIAQIQTPATA